MRLAALVHLDLELWVGRSEPLEEPDRRLRVFAFQRDLRQG